MAARYVEVLPNGIATGSQEVGGILLCLSCHDGNLTQSNMMQNWSYEQQIGLLTNTTYGSQKIPTLLGNDGTTAGNYTNDHPVGQNANISTTGNGLVWANNVIHRHSRISVRSVRSQLRLAGTGARKVFEPLRRQQRWQALRGLHYLPQPARDDGLHVLRV